MSVIWILFVCSIVVLPATALLAFRWALRHGEFTHLEKTALSIFDEEEPVGRISDHFPPSRTPRNASTASPEPIPRDRPSETLQP